MYKTDFVVKYHDIENELILNLHRKMMRQHELEDIAEKQAAAAKVAADLLEKEKQLKALEEAAAAAAAPVKKKAGRKKATKEEPVVQTQDVSVEEPKKRGRKKAVKVEPLPMPIVEHLPVVEPLPLPTVEEPKKEKQDDNDNDDDDCEDLEYTMDDVHLICEKLFRDELLSVFGVETINDPNMDAGIKRVIEKMIDNKNFKQLLDDIKHELIDFSNFSGTPTQMENIRRNSEYLIFITLFSQHVFYITHKCICQLFTLDDVDPNLMDRLKDKTISLFKKN
jgi:hypothetical protein